MLTTIIIAIILFLIFDYYQRFYKPKTAAKTWPGLAARTGLTYQPPTGSGSTRTLPYMTGTYRKHDLKLDLSNAAYSVMDDGIARYRTRIVLTLNCRINGLVLLARKGFFGSDDGLKIGDDEFDRKYVIDSQPENLAGRFLATTWLRQRLMETDFVTFKVSDLGLLFEKGDVENNVEQLHSFLDLICDIAEEIERRT